MSVNHGHPVTHAKPLASSFAYDTANRKPQSEVRRLPFDVTRIFNFSNAALVFLQNKGFMGNIIDFSIEQMNYGLFHRQNGCCCKVGISLLLVDLTPPLTSLKLFAFNVKVFIF